MRITDRTDRQMNQRMEACLKEQKVFVQVAKIKRTCYKNPSAQNTKLHIAGMAFVDDTDTLQNSTQDTDTVEDVLRLAQGNVDHWEGAIRATGGALDPQKTH